MKDLLTAIAVSTVERVKTLRIYLVKQWAKIIYYVSEEEVGKQYIKEKLALTNYMILVMPIQKMHLISSPWKHYYQAKPSFQKQ